MASYLVCYESLPSRDAASSTLRNDASSCHWERTVAWVDANTQTNPLVGPKIPASCNKFTEPYWYRADFKLNETPAVIAIGYGLSRLDDTLFNGAALANGGFSCLDPLLLWGRNAAPYRLLFGGAVEAAMDAIPVGASDSIDVLMHGAYQAESYQGLHHFCEFELEPPDTQAVGGSRLAELLYLFQNAAARYLLGVNGAAQGIYAEACGFAGISPEATVYIRPEDWQGTDPDQIPAAVSDNQPSQFRAHPSVFYPSGKPTYTRALTRGYVDNVDIAQGDLGSGGMPLGIVNITSAITTSDWLIMIDGVAQLVKLTHPLGSDYRRPRDIWNNVWVPLLTGPKSISDATLFGQVGLGNGGAIGTRFQYGDYFRCLPIPGTRVTQTASG